MTAEITDSCTNCGGARVAEKDRYCRKCGTAWKTFRHGSGPGNIVGTSYLYDGLSIDDKFLLIHQRRGKGDVTIPFSQITGVTSFTKKGFLFSRDTARLQITVGGKRYVVRRLPIAAQEEVVRVIRARIGLGG